MLSLNGKVRKVIKEAGLYFNPLLHYDFVSTDHKVLKIKRPCLPDGNDEPLKVALNVSYKVSHPIRFKFAVENPQQYLKN